MLNLQKNYTNNTINTTILLDLVKKEGSTLNLIKFNK